MSYLDRVFENASEVVTIPNAINFTGNMVVGTSGTNTVAFTAKLGSQLYSNLTGTSYTILKIHNHNTTAEIGGAEFKGELVNTTGTVEGVSSQWSYAPTGNTGAPALASGGSFHLAIATAATVTTGEIYGCSGQVTIYGTLNGGTVNVIGVKGIVAGAGATTLCLHIAGVSSAISAGVVNPTAGTLSHYLADSTGTTVIDNLICMQDSQYITNFASFNLAAADKCIEEATSSMGANPTSHAIHIKVGGVDGWIPVFDTNAWT